MDFRGFAAKQNNCDDENASIGRSREGMLRIVRSFTDAALRTILVKAFLARGGEKRQLISICSFSFAMIAPNLSISFWMNAAYCAGVP